ncbi:tRNA (adenosine(37)-N6)-threonylcarbamoyltransferase complex dimerization subunit type 1 TsaB [Paucibacter sp. APW11]|uniref:tRNA (Adenosine(37)-N6)-threonylcarbamoyltransferase complex dimerization subunit type 1 TsaB n=1 Tax=Roseateles aquae TaxID=3077235 RepID=A0ABU3PAN0_9BURK|nr:tRNA (adenosine(37)-N6)-threonylcarbamoyltransferase complex dimerization subunit type 1 TsaB [Paucibacter sp. APW11]MDT8999646.1 tRNA (adenosine(37)-N6)-threonylcarbamoyltransferase complex dimerization subunit type 1 TsaB [Paucibacter sp. APW11]
MTVLLALDSSTDTMAIALLCDAGLGVFEGAAGAQSSARMVPEAMALLTEAGLQLADVDAIAFGAGPGAFTGLRTACAVAQGLALGAGKPVLAVDSLMLVAEDARQQAEAAGEAPPETIWVAMDARMDEIYAASYRWQQGRWQCGEAPALYSAAALREHWQGEPEAVAGSALGVFDLGLQQARRWPQPASRARALAALAAQLHGQGLAMDAAEAMPVYVRDKVAQTTAERQALQAAKASGPSPNPMPEQGARAV